MNRFVAVIMIVGAVILHLAFCEWDFRDDLKGVAQSQNERIIFHRHRSYASRKRGDYLPRNVFLLAKPSADRDEAQLYGVLAPVLIVGAAGLMFYIERQSASA